MRRIYYQLLFTLVLSALSIMFLGCGDGSSPTTPTNPPRRAIRKSDVQIIYQPQEINR